MLRYDEVVLRKEVENARWAQEMDTMKQAHELALQAREIEGF